MCSIYGAVGSNYIDEGILRAIQANAKDRGRDGGRFEYFMSDDELVSAALGNWRATPTPEPEVGPLQPYHGMVHNGTIANDAELGGSPGDIDSMALARFLDRNDLRSLVTSLRQVKGSYALACFNGKTGHVLAATNYKPLHYADIGGTIYFSSMARHFNGVLPFGQAPVALPPYTAINFLTHEQIGIPKTNSPAVVVIASSGLDSTVVATKLVREGRRVCLLHFTYGCNAETREAAAIARIAESLECSYCYLPVDLRQMLGKKASTLFQAESMTVGAIQGAEYAHEWVPGRNLVFVALAVAWAEAHGYHAVALGNNLEEAGAYPDNEEQFTTLLNHAMPYAVQAHYGMELLTPVGNLMKHEIVKLGLSLNTPFEHTWSCYRGGEKHCGKCGPCFMRSKAFERSGEADPVFLQEAKL